MYRLNVHCHVVFLEGVYLDRTEADLKPRFIKVEPTSDADIAEVLQKISRRVIRTLRQLGYLETGIDAVATGYDPLRDDEPELARTMAASVTQRIAFGKRAGQHVRRIGPGFGYEGERLARTGPRCARVHGFPLHANTGIPAHQRDQLERLIRYTGRGAVSLERLAEDAHGDLVYTFSRPWSDGTTGITLSPLEFLEKLAALVPVPRVHLVRYTGCLAPHSALREAMIPTLRQQGVEEQVASTASLPWSWARLLKRVCALEMARCPFCQRGALRIIATITQGEVISTILRHLQHAADLPPIAPARSRQETFDWVAYTHGVARGLRSDVRAVEMCLPPLSVEIPFESSRPTIPDGPTPLPSYAACPDRTARRDVVLWAAGSAPAMAVPKGRLIFLSAHRSTWHHLLCNARTTLLLRPT